MFVHSVVQIAPGAPVLNLFLPLHNITRKGSRVTLCLQFPLWFESIMCTILVQIAPGVPGFRKMSSPLSSTIKLLLNFAQRPIITGLRFFNEPEISDSGPPA